MLLLEIQIVNSRMQLTESADVALRGCPFSQTMNIEPWIQDPPWIKVSARHYHRRKDKWRVDLMKKEVNCKLVQLNTVEYRIIMPNPHIYIYIT